MILPDWYINNIEEPIQELVYLLRNNGFNTECSCGEKMYVQCQYDPEGELQRLHNLLYNSLHEKKLPINYQIEITIKVVDGNMISSLIIYLNEKPKEV